LASTEQLPNGRWRGIYRIPGGRKGPSKTFDHKRAALAWAVREEDKARRGGRTDPHGAKMPWGEWFDQWEPTRQVAGSTRSRDDSRVEQHVRPRWGAIPLGGIARLAVQRWVTKDLPAAGLSASSIHKCYYLLSSSLDAAVHEGLLEASPCVGIKLPTLPPGRERFLDDEEVLTIRNQLDREVYRLFVDTLVGTGIRISEGAGLHRARVDLDALTIRVAEVWDVRSRTMIGYPKGRKARTVPIADELGARLAAWFEASPATGDCGQRPIDPGSGSEGRCPGPLVFTGPGRWANSRRGPLDPHNFTNRVWPAALEATAVRDEDGNVTVPPVEHCTPHDLRHTYASRLVRRGVELIRVRDLLGHESIKTTERYAHLAPNQHDDIRAVLNGGQDHGTSHGTEGRPTRPRRATPRTRLRSL
jgi:integrase